MHAGTAVFTYTCRRAHHESMETKGAWYRPAFALSLLVPLGGAAGCTYEFDEPAHTTAPAQAADSPTAYIDPLVIEREVKNYREVDRLLKAVPGPVLLFEEGPLDGPVRGFGATAEVPASGKYTVTAACAGASGAKVAIGQEHPGSPFRPVELALDCIAATIQVMELQQGYVFAHLVLPTPGDTPWTGAVGGVRVTGEAPPPSTEASILTKVPGAPAPMRQGWN